LFTFITTGAVLQMNIGNNQFTDALFRIDAGLFGSGKNALIYTDNIEDAVTITARPVTGTGVVVADNVVV